LTGGYTISWTGDLTKLLLNEVTVAILTDRGLGDVPGGSRSLGSTHGCGR
jgi:hypothetical protein